MRGSAGNPSRVEEGLQVGGIDPPLGCGGESRGVSWRVPNAAAVAKAKER